MQYSYTWEWRDDARATRMGLRALAVVVPRQMWVWKKATKTSVISSWMSKYCTVICTAETSKADMNTDISIKGTIKENLRFSSISSWRYTDHHLLLINDSKHLSLFNLIFVLKWLQAKLFVFLSSLWSTAHKQKKKTLLHALSGFAGSGLYCQYIKAMSIISVHRQKSLFLTRFNSDSFLCLKI